MIYSGIGWFIARTVLIDSLSLDYAIGWGIGGFVMGWQLLNKMSKVEQ